MFLLLFILVGLVLGIALGGDLRRLAALRLRWSGLVLLALALQIAVFSSFGREWLPSATAQLHMASYALLVGFALLNRRQPGFCLMGAGLLSNLAVIWANNGYMPALAQHLEWLGIYEEGILNNSCVIGPDTPLWWLGDVFLLPLPVLGNVFSIGDLLLGAGAAWFTYRTLKPVEYHGGR
ncbi:MAG: DUF5317 domain-containing protein [Firmicutes bacterium]|nr:DUF5317 domain-containing protein [Bacillota bacterium]